MNLKLLKFKWNSMPKLRPALFGNCTSMGSRWSTNAFYPESSKNSGWLVLRWLCGLGNSRRDLGTSTGEWMGYKSWICNQHIMEMQMQIYILYTAFEWTKLSLREKSIPSCKISTNRRQQWILEWKVFMNKLVWDRILYLTKLSSICSHWDILPSGCHFVKRTSQRNLVHQ